VAWTDPTRKLAASLTDGYSQITPKNWSQQTVNME